ncbi:MAG TPA: oligosaccharide flippase family protein [Candidatus Eisenbacteria bacterium]|jgi:O-antigen/teichoic acid export membrane protein|nr:oligosaccharide flippase family protein [Candidatus Eisenbacteria bacterium]
MRIRQPIARLLGAGAIGRLAGDSVLYGLGTALGRVFQIALVPILTRVFSPAEYGVVDLVMTVSVLATMITVSGMDAALARSFYEAPDTEARRRKATTSALHRLVFGTLMGGLVVLFARPLSTVLLDSPSYVKYVRILGLAIPFSSFYLFANEALRVTFQPAKYIGLNALNMALVGALTLWFVLVLKYSVAGVFWARVLSDAITALAGLVLLRHTLTRRGGTLADLKSMLAYGAPLLPVTFIYYVLTYADRQILLRFGMLASVGIYAVAVKVAAPLLIAVTAFQLAWGPSAFAAAERPDHPRVFSRVLDLYVAGATTLALVVGLLAPELVRLFAPRPYWGAAQATGLLALATVAQGAYQIAALGVNLARKNYWLIVTTGLAALVTVGLGILFVRPWGVTGVAWATLIGFSLSTIFLYLKSQSLRPFPYRGLACLGLFALAAGIESTTAWTGFSVGGLIVRTALMIGFAIVAWRFVIAGRGRVTNPAPQPVEAL